MTTPATLAIHGKLIQYELPADDPAQPERSLYLTPDCWQWVEDSLDYEPQTDWPKRPDEPVLPAEQVDLLFERFVRGKRMSRADLKPLIPIGDGVWELKSSDVRVFGFFHRPKLFIAVCGGMATAIKKGHQYSEYKRRVIAAMFALGLDEPKIDLAGDPNALL